MTDFALIIDLDTTLIATHVLYQACRYLGVGVTKTHGGSVDAFDEALAWAETRAEKALSPQEYISPLRYPVSVGYGVYSATGKQDVGDSVRIGCNHILQATPDTYRDAAPFLKKVQSAGIPIHLFTHGIENHQMMRVSESGLEPYFDSITVTLTKDEDTWGAFDNAADHIIAIGDSLRHDIRPALRCGYTAIHVDRGAGWGQADMSGESKYLVAHNLDDAGAFMKDILAGRYVK